MVRSTKNIEQRVETGNVWDKMGGLAVLNRVFMENKHLCKHMKEVINQTLLLSEGKASQAEEAT